MSEERKYGIRGYPRFDQNTGVQIYIFYTIDEWGRKSMYTKEIAEEPMTYEEARALVKLLEEDV